MLYSSYCSLQRLSAADHIDKYPLTSLRICSLFVLLKVSFVILTRARTIRKRCLHLFWQLSLLEWPVCSVNVFSVCPPTLVDKGKRTEQHFFFLKQRERYFCHHYDKFLRYFDYQQVGPLPCRKRLPKKVFAFTQ
jgi:hypothetical protein